MIASAPAAAATLYVDDDAPPGGSGLSWDAPLRFLQDAMQMAPLLNADEIRVAAGLYHPDDSSQHPQGSGSRTAVFSLRNGVRLLGGYPGFDAPEPDTRDPQQHVTLLSADLNDNDHDQGYFNHYENAFRLVVADGVGPQTLLDGFTLRGGYADTGANLRGGALLNIESRVIVRNCHFDRNTAIDVGGAVFNDEGDATYIDCLFTNNRGGAGGGISNLLASPRIVGCTFIDNSTMTPTAGGGAISNVSYCDAEISFCTFAGNEASKGGAIHNRQVSNSRILGCRFTGNYCLLDGGAIFNDVVSHPSIVNCTFDLNEALGRGGAIATWMSGHPEITNCTFWRNSAQNGGALYSRGLDAIATVTNCILWDDAPNEQYLEFGGVVTYNTSIVMNNADPASGVIDADPLFLDPENGDFRLHAESPGVDAGKNDVLPAEITTDGARQPRFVDHPSASNSQCTGPATCIPVDLGSHEHQFDCGNGDLNCDGAVNVDDLVLILVLWGDCDGCTPDFDDNGVVDVNDLLAVIIDWTG